MNNRLFNFRSALLLLLALLAVTAAGCATTDEPENMSERPWNSPKGWEHGIPGAMYDRR